MKQTFRILHTEWSSGWGGQEQRILLESLMLQRLGHQVLIAGQPESGILAKARAAGIPVAEVRIRRAFDPLALIELTRLMRAEKIDVVNTHSGKDSWVAGFAAKLAGADLLIRTRHLSVPISNHPLNFVYRMPDGIVTTGEALRETMVRDNRIPAQKIISIATGVPLERFEPTLSGTTIRKEFGIPQEAPLITMVAVLRSMKRHDLLVETAALLKQDFPQLRWLIVGEGPKRGAIERQIEELGLQKQIRLTGYRQDIPQILAASDIAVLTSDKFEGVPQSLSQAMAMGKPVIAAPIGSTRELIEDGQTGLLAETGQATSFAAGVARLLRDEPLRARLGQTAREHILARYSDRIMAERTIAFYQELLRRKQRSD